MSQAWDRARETAAAPDNDASIYWAADLDLLVRAQRTKLTRIDRLLELLELRPGMDILDVGAGTGQQSYKLAERLHGTGRVLAADIDRRLTDYVAAQARQKGLANLRAVHIGRNGPDPAAIAERFDLILLYDVVHHLQDPVNYYRRMKRLLKVEGRVVVVTIPSRSFGFFYEDFEDWEGFVSVLHREPATTPFGRALAQPLEALLDVRKPAAGRALEETVLLCLNRLLDQTFFAYFVDEETFHSDVSFNAIEQPFALRLLHRLRAAGLPEERSVAQVNVGEFCAMQMLNRMLLIQRFREHLTQRTPGPYVSASTLPERDYPRPQFEFADYRLEKRHEFPPFQTVWAFAPCG